MEYRPAVILVNRQPVTGLSDHFRMDFGQRLRRRRKELDLTQQELAALSGIKQGTLSDLERGRTEQPMGETLTGLCKALRTSARWLLTGKGAPDVTTASISEQEERAIALARMMDAEQFETWLRIGHALLDRQDGTAEMNINIPLRVS